MPDWLDKARETMTRTAAGVAPAPFERPCVCGETVYGDRQPQAQEVACPGCGRAWFILPLDPYPRPRPRPAKASLWRRLGAGRHPAAGASSAEIDTVPVSESRDRSTARPAPAARSAAPPKPKRPPLVAQVKQQFAAAKQATKDRLKRAARPIRVVAAGIVVLLIVTGAWLWHRARVDAASATLVAVVPQAEEAIRKGDPVAAERLLARAAAAVDVLGTEDATAARVRQRYRELVAINGLGSQTPYDLAAQAERLAVDPTRWTEQFAASNAGEWVILDVSAGSPEVPTPLDEPANAKDQEKIATPSGKVVRLDLPLAAGKVPVRFEIDASALQPLGGARRVVLAAQYDSWRRHGEGDAAVWVVRFRPRTAFLWSSADLYAARGIDVDAPDDPVRPVLAAQSKALGVPEEEKNSRDVEIAKEEPSR